MSNCERLLDLLAQHNTLSCSKPDKGACNSTYGTKFITKSVDISRPAPYSENEKLEQQLKKTAQLNELERRIIMFLQQKKQIQIKDEPIIVFIFYRENKKLMIACPISHFHVERFKDERIPPRIIYTGFL